MADSTNSVPTRPANRSAESGNGSVPRPAKTPSGGSWSRVVRVVIIAALLVGTGTGGYLLVSHWPSASPRPRADGPTLYGALMAINQSVIATPGGPWTLSQVYGIASPVPSDPSSWGWGPYDAVLASCQSAFNGITLWNGTIPLFTGTYDSGTAPFWQLVFFSNASQQLLVATVVQGVAHVYPPIAMTSTCAVGTGLSKEPWGLSQLFNFSHSGFPGNSQGMAAAAWAAYGRAWTDWVGLTPTEMFLMGAAQFGSGQPPDTMTSFFSCGTQGAAGATPGLDVFTEGPDTAGVGGSFNYTIGCTPTANNWSAIPIRAEFSNSSTEAVRSGEAVSTKLQLWYTGSAPYNGPAYNAAGVTSWMVRLNLTDSQGNPLPVADSVCSTWVPSVADCAASATGWYAVLLSPSDEWDGAYGSTATGPGWNYPVLPIANNETIALIVPTSWNVSGDLLQIASTTPELPLTGSVELA